MRSGAWIVDHALRVLAAGCAEFRPVPPVGAVILGPESVTLRLTTPDEMPPPGWEVADFGRTWLAALPWLETAVVDDRIPEPYPLLVSAGDTGTGRLLLNLAQADGLISVEGDPDRARNLVRSWSRRLTTSPWSAGAQVIRVGFPPDTDFGGWDVSRLVEVSAVLDQATGILLFADRPLGRDTYHVERLLSEPLRRWAVVAVGVEDATWRFTVNADSTLETGLLSLPELDA
ncbi:hypothetical protein [Actinoplanes sp. NPDC026619]|uniref:hypothetical protein n=1 Tax=Actinoplanes sp. NPDC026619 TaxID=3155798 RepID=UPI003411E1E1